jgi:hypothetical protein
MKDNIEIKLADFWHLNNQFRRSHGSIEQWKMSMFGDILIEYGSLFTLRSTIKQRCDYSVTAASLRSIMRQMKRPG